MRHCRTGFSPSSSKATVLPSSDARNVAVATDKCVVPTPLSVPKKPMIIRSFDIYADLVFIPSTILSDSAADQTASFFDH